MISRKRVAFVARETAAHIFRIMLQHANSGELIAARGFTARRPGGCVPDSVKGGLFAIRHSVHFGLILVAALIFAF